MTVLVLALVLLGSSVLGVAGASVLGSLQRRTSLSISLGGCVVYASILIWQPPLPWVPNLSVLLAGSCFGFLFGRLLGSSAAVLAFLSTAAAVDFFSFSDGLTNQIVESYRAGGSTLLRYLAVFVMMDGREFAVVGVSDLAIIAAAYLGLRRGTGSEWEPAGWLLLGLLSAFFFGLLQGGAPGIPFLAAGGWAFVLLHNRRRPSRSPPVSKAEAAKETPILSRGLGPGPESDLRDQG